MEIMTHQTEWKINLFFKKRKRIIQIYMYIYLEIRTRNGDQGHFGPPLLVFQLL